MLRLHMPQVGLGWPHKAREKIHVSGRRAYRLTPLMFPKSVNALLSVWAPNRWAARNCASGRVRGGLGERTANPSPAEAGAATLDSPAVTDAVHHSRSRLFGPDRGGRTALTQRAGRPPS